MTIDWLAAGTLVLNAATGTVRSTIIAITLLVMGAPVTKMLSCNFKDATPIPALQLICGLFSASVLSWYAFRFGMPVSWVYSFLLAVGTALSAALLVRGGFAEFRRTVVLPYAMASVAFIAPVFVYSLLSFAKIRTGTLPLLTIGNGDLLAYLKLGDVLLHLPAAATQISTTDLRDFIGDDVFGSFNLVSLSSFILRTGVEKCAIPVLGFGIGLISLCVVNFCQRVFALPAWLSIIVATLLTSSPLFSYIVLNYFLAQILFIGILLASFLHIAEVAEKSERSLRAAVAAILLASVCVMFVYHPWFLQYLALTSAALGAALIARNGSIKISNLLRAASAFVSIFLAANIFDLAIGSSRYIIAARKIMFAAADGVAGWPMPFVNLTLLLGLPGDWHTPETAIAAAGQVIPVLVIGIVWLAVACRYDRFPARPQRLYVLICFLTGVLLYLVAWNYYGASYRQWKFATTLVAPFGFVVLAYALFAMLQQSNLATRRILIACSCVAALVCIRGNIEQYFNKWSVPAFAFHEGLRDVAKAENAQNAQAVYIDVPEIIEKMAAAIYVDNKPIIFSGPTNYGQGTKSESLPYETVAVFREACPSSRQEPSYSLSTGAPTISLRAAVPVGVDIPLSAPDSSCFTLHGFSGAEPWGRWTDGKSASLELRCDCDLTKKNTKLVFSAGTYLLPGKVDRQRVNFIVNGSPVQSKILASMAKSEILLEAPPCVGEAGKISVKIELPDAISPPGDSRVLGLSISSFAIRQ
ncbi:hypothetical protein AB4Y43_08285 [Paraburkholderia sp. BR10872]|uniref:hypothetical protein n=1 Tax=Paraburkholderia sp. BR10872 TaxID=3236989 RepID=UPI0034D17BB9